jgi:uncharacterized membrane protein
MHSFFVIEFVVSGLLLAAASIPMILGKVPPNRLYGFRTRKTLSSPDIWYKANEYGGKLLAVAGAVITLAALVLAGLTMTDNAYATSMLVILMATLGAATIMSFIYLRTL